jgi:NAD(P) transhydrogenase subunit alpha
MSTSSNQPSAQRSDAQRGAQRIGIPRETFPLEKRVATVPDVVEKLIKLGFSVAIESGAGDAANFSDDAYRAVGAEVLPNAAAVWAAADIIFKVRPPTRRSRADARRPDPDRLHLAGPEPRSDAATGRQR